MISKDIAAEKNGWFFEPEFPCNEFGIVAHHKRIDKIGAGVSFYEQKRSFTARIVKEAAFLKVIATAPMSDIDINRMDGSPLNAGVILEVTMAVVSSTVEGVDRSSIGCLITDEETVLDGGVWVAAIRV
jgi:hypothetical protein